MILSSLLLMEMPRPRLEQPGFTAPTEALFSKGFPSEHKCREHSTKYIYFYRVPQCMSPRRNWDSPTPSLTSECVPTPRTKGGGTLACGWGVGGVPIPTTGEKACRSAYSVEHSIPYSDILPNSEFCLNLINRTQKRL